MIESYYDILKIKRDANIEEIKIAFRKRAKELHPDRNPSTDAHDQFVLLNEAYQYLIRAKSSNRPVRTAEKQRNHRRAKQYAYMRYDKFVDTDYFKSIDAVNNIFDYFYLIFGILFLIAIPLGLTIAFGWLGLIIGLIPLLLSAKFIQLGFKNAKLVSLKELWDSFVHLFSSEKVQLIILSLVNLIMMFKYGFSAAIYSFSFVLIYMGIPVLVYYLLKKRKSKWKRLKLIGFGFIPLIFNLFFAINYSFSKNPEIKIYQFNSVQHQISTKSEPNTVLVLENNALSNYFHFRFIWDFDQLKSKSYVAYQFEEGLLGVGVLKDYQLYSKRQLKQRNLSPTKK